MKLVALPLVLVCVACRTPAPPVGVADGSSPFPAPKTETKGVPMKTAPTSVVTPRAAARGALNAEQFAALRRKLCVTEGELSGAEGRNVAASKMRCVEPESTGDRARLLFAYVGPTKERSRLKSGAERQQLGLKLRARDSCNLLYVMWRILPTPSVVVSFKNNPDQSSHTECENGGYANLKPTLDAPPPAISPGSEYELRAEITGSTLTARIDDEIVWQGSLPEDVLELKGPAGFRSDNVAWTVLDFDAGTSEGVTAAEAPHCRNPQ